MLQEQESRKKHVMTLDHICARLLISGKVQGVGFRIALRDQARQVGVVGWVRNTPDGYVEAYLEGGNAAVRRIISWCYGVPHRHKLSACRSSGKSQNERSPIL